MNARKIFICIFLLGFLGNLSFKANAYVERNLLQKLADETTLKNVLIEGKAWVPYPTYTDRQGWNALVGTENKQHLIKAGELLLDYKWQVIPATAYLEYERSGDRNVMQDPFEANRKALNTLMLAELAEGKGRFIDQLINGVYMSCEMNSWVLSAHLIKQTTGRSLPDFREQIIDLTSGGYGVLLSWIHYFFREQFDAVDPVIALQIQDAIRHKILEPYMKDSGLWWMGFNLEPGGIVNNWNPWCNSDVLQCFLLMENDRNHLVKAIYRTMLSVDKFINYVKSDGACEEGTSYWGHAAGKLCDYLQLLSQCTAGKVSLLGDPTVRYMGEYISRSYVGNGWVVNFADASARGGGDPLLIYRYGKLVGSDEMMHFAAYLLNGGKPSVTLGNDAFRSLESLLCCAELLKVEPKHDVSNVTWYPETEVCYMKSEEGMFVATKGGYNNESHNHNDIGTFSLYVNTIPVFIDAGVGTYTRETFSKDRYKIWTMQSNFHNLPMINGVPQVYGEEYKATNAVCNVKKRTFSVDIATAYPKEANVKSWVRSYELTNHQLVIKDKYSLNKATEPNQVNFMSWGKITFPSSGKVQIEVKGQKVEMEYPACFKANVETIALDDPRLSGVWGKEIYRLTLKTDEKKINGSYTFTIRQIK